MPADAGRSRPDANFVKGCMSTVHVAARRQAGAGDVIEFLGDSNTPIVKGLIAIVQRAGRPAGRRRARVRHGGVPPRLG
jgi:sulfur transfer protein SufE